MLKRSRAGVVGGMVPGVRGVPTYITVDRSRNRISTGGIVGGGLWGAGTEDVVVRSATIGDSTTPGIPIEVLGAAGGRVTVVGHIEPKKNLPSKNLFILLM